MTEETIIEITQQTLFVIIECAAPLLLISLIIGLVISIFQTVTSIQEQTLTFVPKLLCVFVGILIFGNWILNNIVTLMEQLWSNFGAFIEWK